MTPSVRRALQPFRGLRALGLQASRKTRLRPRRLNSLLIYMYVAIAPRSLSRCCGVLRVCGLALRIASFSRICVFYVRDRESFCFLYKSRNVQLQETEVGTADDLLSGEDRGGCESICFKRLARV